MAQDPPGWYYVGNGQLRYKFGDFWTDQYKTIGHSEQAVPAENLESSDPVPAHTSPNAGMPRLRTTRLIAVACACLLGLGVGGGLLQPDIRHELVSWAEAQASNLSALISRPASPTPSTTRDATAKAEANARANAEARARANAEARARANAEARARANARAAAKVKPTPAHPVAPHPPATKPKTKVAEPPATPAHTATKPPVTPPSSPPKSIPRSVANPR
ncbi:MAG: hypothetical protein HHJ13_12750 [Phycicoccus sp.]|nr:hypothetical protein [Phycicoccus sp.]